MKISICDPCKSFDNKTVETNKYMSVKGKPHLRLDTCPSHESIVKNLTMVDYVRYVYKCMGIDLTQTDDQIKLQFLGR